MATLTEKQIIFDEVFIVAEELMIDFFGNYVMQKVVELGTKEQKRLMGDRLVG
jgi:hypothetical protein